MFPTAPAHYRTDSENERLLKQFLEQPTWRLGPPDYVKWSEAACMLVGVDHGFSFDPGGTRERPLISWVFLPGGMELAQEHPLTELVDGQKIKPPMPEGDLDQAQDFCNNYQCGHQPNKVLDRALSAGFIPPWLKFAMSRESLRRLLSKKMVTAGRKLDSRSKTERRAAGGTAKGAKQNFAFHAHRDRTFLELFGSGFSGCWKPKGKEHESINVTGIARKILEGAPTNPETGEPYGDRALKEWISEKLSELGVARVRQR